ncbi:MAG: diaminopimelate epimerase [Nocardioidaceae bacterium]
MNFPFVKGHGTHNDFVVLPDLDGTVHGDLAPDVVAALCDRRGGIGADGVLRVLRGDVDGGADWFMDYRNADGSVSEMCGNGIRVFARYLAEAGLVDVAGLTAPLPIDTRDGIKLVTFCDDGEISVDMGNPKVAGDVTVSLNGHAMPGRKVDMGNPHAVLAVDDLASLGELSHSPIFCSAEYPDGVNVEFVVRRGDRHLAMRVFERGSGETWSCGTGACAVVAAAISADPGADLPQSYRLDVPGGTLTVTWDNDDHIHLKGDAVLVASGTWTPS